MGADIHCYIEYRHPEESGDWWSFGGRINPGRDYTAFGRLAGVRRELPRAVIEPRGIPNGLGWKAGADWWLFVPESLEDVGDEATDTLRTLMLACLADPSDSAAKSALCDELQVTLAAEANGRNRCPRASYCTAEEAERYAKEYGKRVRRRSDGKPERVEHPDWHTPTWLTPDEWEKATKGAGAEYHAITGAMRALEKAGNEVRVVMWFDN